MSYSAADVKYDIDNLRHHLELPETEESWDKIAGAFKTFTSLCEAGAFDANPTEVVSTVRLSHRQIVSAMNSERTRLSLTAMDFMSALATSMGRSFDQVMALFLPPLLGLCARTNKVIIKGARGSIFTIIETTQLANVLTYLQQLTKDKSSSLKLVIAEGTLACLNSCNPPDLEKEARALEVEDIIRVTARDANADVRKVSRKIFDSYKILMPSRLANFTAPMSPTTRKYLDIKGPTLSTHPSTSSLRSATATKPSTSIRPGHSRTASSSTTASNMASTTARNAPTTMTRVTRKDPSSHSTALASSRPTQAMRINPDTQSTGANAQRKVVAPVRPVRSTTTADVRRPPSQLSTHTTGPSRGTTTAAAALSSNAGAPHRLPVKPSTTQLRSAPAPSGTSSGPRRVPVMAPPAVPAAAAAKEREREKDGPKRPTSRLDNATSTSATTQRFAPTKKPAVPTAASSRDVKSSAASSDAAKGKATSPSTVPAASGTRPTLPSTSSLKARSTAAPTSTTTSTTNALNATKAQPAVKAKPTWGKPVQPAKPVPVPRRTVTAPAAPQKAATTAHAARPASRTAAVSKAAPGKFRPIRTPTPSSQEEVKGQEATAKVEAPEVETVVEARDAKVSEPEEQKAMEPVASERAPTPVDEVEERVGEVQEVEEHAHEAEVEEADKVVEVAHVEEEEEHEEEEEVNDEQIIEVAAEDPLNFEDAPHTPEAFATGPSAHHHHAAALATKTPISTLLNSIERGFMYTPVTPLSPAELYLPNGATPYSHSTHAPHLHGGPTGRQPFNHALYAQGENGVGGIFGGFARVGMQQQANLKREEDVLKRGELGVVPVPLHEHQKLFRGAGMSSLDDANRQAFLELNQ